MKKIAIITGASSGLGVEFALQAENAFGLDEIWIVARREEGLKKVAASLKQAKAVILPLDLSAETGLTSLREKLTAERPDVRLLVVNAGAGRFGGFGDISRVDNLAMIDLNVRSLTALTYDVGPFLSAGSGVVLVASMVAYLPMAGLNVYSATKAYVRSFGLALHAEWAERGITVTTLSPGPVDTEFASVASGGQSGPLPGGMAADRVVARTYRALKKRRWLILPRFSWTLTAMLSRLMPGAWIANATKQMYR